MSQVIVVQPGEGESISGGTSERHVDAFYVLEGELEVAVSETETVRLGPGGLAVAPPGALHTFGVRERARFLNIHAPGMGFATYLRELVAIRGRSEEPP